MVLKFYETVRQFMETKTLLDTNIVKKYMVESGVKHQNPNP
jgi:hypothetical protein